MASHWLSLQSTSEGGLRVLLIVLAYLGGVLTIVSPCVLPVLPFIFSRAEQPFLTSGLPLLMGMALTFAGVASLAAVGGGWVVEANEYGRWAALALLAFFSLALLWPSFAERLARPLVSAGSRISNRVGQSSNGRRPGAALFVGVATGLLWAPCAGPILGLVLTGAALQGANAKSSLLLLAYALGAATSMGVALLLGARVFAALKRSLGAGQWTRRVIGIAMLAGVAAIALGLDRGLLTELSTASTLTLEQKLVDGLIGDENTPGIVVDGGPAMMMQATGGESPAMMSATPVSGASNGFADKGLTPALNGASDWLNSPPLTREELRGKVVLVDFWTYSCINCLRTLPYVKAWSEKYRDQGLIVVGVHSPEFAFERKLSNVEKATRDLGIRYPVAVDNDYKIWRAFDNRYWPAHYFIDAQGRVRHHHFGEGGYAESERMIQRLLREAGATGLEDRLSLVEGHGIHLAPDFKALRSPETYLGYERALNFVSVPAAVRNQVVSYSAPKQLALNTWALAGRWSVGPESATLDGASGRISYRFQARDLHLVLGPAADGRPVRFKVQLDGRAPNADRGVDLKPDGSGTVTEQRLYQLIRQHGDAREREVSIEFLDAGVSAYAFTFG